MAENAYWVPGSQVQSQSNMAQFLSFVNKTQNKSFSNYQELYQWSITDTEGFWGLLAQFCQIKWRKAPLRAYTPSEKGGIRGHKWFEKGRLNFAENLMPEPSEAICMTAYREGSETPYHISGKELWEKVARLAHWLRGQGVVAGDRVVGVMANTPEAVMAMLASTSIGAIWSSCSPDFGVGGISDRFGQIDPKVVFYTYEYHYNGKKFGCLDIIRESLPMEGALRARVAVPIEEPLGKLDLPDVRPGETTWGEVLEGSYSPLTFEETDFDHPVYILFSSGTTGVPKCIVHGAGGTLLQHKKELSLHADLSEGKSLFYFTTCGWMMWNWMVSALSVGSRVVLYEGSVGYPSLDRLWRIVADEKVSVFGTSPKFLSACSKEGVLPGKNDLSNLECLLSTGSPLLPEHGEWVYGHVPKSVRLSSISGGTDIVSCFMLGNPLLPVYPGKIQCRGLGMAVESWVGEGEPAIGEKGELVCTKPFVSMPVGFWNDKDGSIYEEAYFNYYEKEKVWRHGDFIEITEDGGVIVYGRSDATLNPGGVRIGTAEIYRQVENMEEILDSLLVGVTQNGDVDIWLFLVMKEKGGLSSPLTKSILSKIRSQLTPRHVPKRVMEVQAIPYTRSGKKVEISVTRIMAGEKVSNSSALANPEALEEYRKIAKEEGFC